MLLQTKGLRRNFQIPASPGGVRSWESPSHDRTGLAPPVLASRGVSVEEHKAYSPDVLGFGLITVSDTRAPADDTSGRLLHAGVADYGIERLYRDVRIFRIYEGTSQIQQLVIARETMKRGG